MAFSISSKVKPKAKGRRDVLPAPSAPPAATPSTDVLTVAIPLDWQPGHQVRVTLKSGRRFFISVPHDARPGGVMTFSTGTVSDTPRVSLTLPENVRPGESLVARAPDGRTILFTAPADAAAGQLLSVLVPTVSENSPPRAGASAFSCLSTHRSAAIPSVSGAPTLVSGDGTATSSETTSASQRVMRPDAALPSQSILQYDSLMPPATGGEAGFKPANEAERMMLAMQLDHDRAAALAAGGEILPTAWASDDMHGRATDIACGFAIEDLPQQSLTQSLLAAEAVENERRINRGANCRSARSALPTSYI